MQWKPIESAPKDGTLIWLVSGGDVHIGYHNEPMAWSESDEGDWILKTAFRENRVGRDIVSTHHVCKPHERPTHWCELPDPPDEFITLPRMEME